MDTILSQILTVHTWCSLLSLLPQSRSSPASPVFFPPKVHFYLLPGRLIFDSFTALPLFLLVSLPTLSLKDLREVPLLSLPIVLQVNLCCLPSRCGDLFRIIFMGLSFLVWIPFTSSSAVLSTSRYVMLFTSEGSCFHKTSESCISEASLRMATVQHKIHGVRKRLYPFFIFFFARCPVCWEWCKLHWLLLDTPSFD